MRAEDEMWPSSCLRSLNVSFANLIVTLALLIHLMLHSVTVYFRESVYNRFFVIKHQRSSAHCKLGVSYKNMIFSPRVQACPGQQFCHIYLWKSKLFQTRIPPSVLFCPSNSGSGVFVSKQRMPWHRFETCCDAVLFIIFFHFLWQILASSSNNQKGREKHGLKLFPLNSGSDRGVEGNRSEKRRCVDVNLLWNRF